jgi:pyruvate ferredoxin oxidoreductase beta subunit
MACQELLKGRLGMDRFSVYAPQLLPKDENFIAGRRSCKGCGKALASRLASKAVSSAQSPPRFKGPSPAASAAEHRYAYDRLATDALINKYFAEMHALNASLAAQSHSRHRCIPKPVIAVNRQIFMHDYLALASVFESDQKALYLCLDNESYITDFIAKTGPQPLIVNEAPHPVSDGELHEIIQEKNAPGAITETHFSYMATACPSVPFDLIEKVHKGLSCTGNAFILILTPCPTGWIFPPRLSKQVGLAAVQTGYFPLYEKDCNGLRLTVRENGQRRPLQQYLALQKRFFTLPPGLIPRLQAEVDLFYNELL